jgi:hypothetical protein
MGAISDKSSTGRGCGGRAMGSSPEHSHVRRARRYRGVGRHAGRRSDWKNGASAPRAAARTGAATSISFDRPSSDDRKCRHSCPTRGDPSRAETATAPREKRGRCRPRPPNGRTTRNANQPRRGTRAEAGSAPAWPGSSESSPRRSWDRGRNARPRPALR